jgi:hypothetical protein
VGFCKQITILIFYRVSSRLVTPFKFWNKLQAQAKEVV